MNHKISLYYIIFWSNILTILVVSHKANGILTDSNDLSCTHIQCPTECPADSYLKSSIDEDEEDFEDYEDPYIEELGQFEELPIDVETHDLHSPQHSLKERQKREVFFQEEIERCCDDQKCVCLKCEDVPKCNEGEVAIEVHEGQGVPGNCCSLFKCVHKQECQIGVKQTWWTSKCKKCFCFGENELCTQICPEEEIIHHCYSEYWQQPKINGEFWKEGRCTSCTCEQGTRRCFTPVCPELDCNNKKTLEDECCPKCVDDEIDEHEIHEVRMCYSTVLQKPILNGDSWKEGTNTTCTCEEGDIKCFTPECPKLACKESKLNEGELCPVCVEETKEEKIEIVHNKDDEIDDNEEEFTTELTTTDMPTIQIEQRNENTSNYPIIDDTLINEAQTTSPFTELEESSSVSLGFKDIEDISSTMEPETNDLLKENAGNISTTTSSTIIDVKLMSSTSPVEDLSSTTETSTEQSKIYDIEISESTSEQSLIQAGIDSTSTTTEEAKSVEMGDDNSSSTTEVILTSSQSESSSGILNSKETTTWEDLLITSTLESFTESSSLYNEESSTNFTSILSSTSSTTEDPQTSSSTEVSSETTPSSSVAFSTSYPFEISSTTESMISSSTQPKTTITDTPLSTTSQQTSTEYSKPSTSSFSSSTISTTSSPFSSTSDDTTSTEFSAPPESSSTSSTSGPETLKPLFQPYGGDFSSGERSLKNQTRLRIKFDKIDYVALIIFFFGSLLVIALVLIINHTKNRKKMYSSIPNSETSLSQKSTNTILTV